MTRAGARPGCEPPEARGGIRRGFPGALESGAEDAAGPAFPCFGHRVSATVKRLVVVAGLAAAALTLTGLAAVPVSASPATLRHALDRFARDPGSADLRYGVVFLPVTAAGDEGGPGSRADRSGGIVRRHEDLPLVPASVAKLPTTALALETLGTDYTFVTRVLATGPQRADTLAGDLVVAGGGDPFLVSERLWLLSREVRAAGIAKVTGRLVIDAAWLAPDSADPVRSREREISDRPYAAKLSALAVNFDAAALRITPGRSPGDPVTVDADPLPCAYLQIENRLVTGPSGAAEQYAVTLAPLGNGGETATLEGTIPAGAPARVEYRSVSDALAFSAALVRAFFTREGIEIAGPTVFAAAPPQARPIAELASLPLRELVARANRYSNNFMADQIALALSTVDSAVARSAADSAPPAAGASLTRAGRRITDYLRRTCGAPAGVRQFDGSGLHPGDRLTAATLARLLQRAWRSLTIGPDLASSLAVPGQDGTLHSRFKDGPVPVMRGKTGTMSDPMVSSIAGYLETGAGEIVVCVILMNAPTAAGWDLARMKAQQESWIREYLRR